MKKPRKIRAAALLTAVLAAVYCNCTLQPEEWVVPSDRLPAAFDGLRIILLTDIHGGRFGPGSETLLEAVKEAEQYAAEDKARKDEVDTHNMADQMVYQSEKTLNELGDKVSEADKAPVLAAIEKVKETLKGTDVEAIKAATEECQKSFYAISEKLYAQQAPQGNPAQGAPADDGVVDADFEEVNDN